MFAAEGVKVGFVEFKILASFDVCHSDSTGGDSPVEWTGLESPEAEVPVSEAVVSSEEHGEVAR
jgi:hypothetical protein